MGLQTGNREGRRLEHLAMPEQRHGVVVKIFPVDLTLSLTSLAPSTPQLNYFVFPHN